MKTEEQKKELVWFEGNPADYYSNYIATRKVMESKAVWGQWEGEHGNAEQGIIKFLRWSDGEESWDSFVVFDGFYGDWPDWEQWEVEYYDLKWYPLSKLIKL